VRWAVRLPTLFLFSTRIEGRCAVAKASRAEVDAAQIQAIFDGMASGMRSSMHKDVDSRRQLEPSARQKISAELRLNPYL